VILAGFLDHQICRMAKYIVQSGFRSRSVSNSAGARTPLAGDSDSRSGKEAEDVMRDLALIHPRPLLRFMLSPLICVGYLAVPRQRMG
jgi:hypothetical protein